MIRSLFRAKRTSVIAHLGAHKTATSLLQKYFKEKKRYYSKRDLHCITRAEVSDYISWGNVVTENPQSLNGYLRSCASRSGASRLFFSNENALGKPFRQASGLYPQNKKIIPGFVKAFEGFDVRIVYSIRPQWDFLTSYYLQKIHQGEYLSFDEFIQTLNLERLSWKPIIENLVEGFGREAVSVLDFCTISEGQTKFIEAFVRDNFTPPIRPDLSYDQVHNASISARGLEIALRVNPLLKPGESGKVRRFLQQNFSNRTESRPDLMPKELKNQLMDMYAGEYEELTSGKF